jgi:dipeptidyl aminopeptidase/acylaminoacyl peptidase
MRAFLFEENSMYKLIIVITTLLLGSTLNTANAVSINQEILEAYSKPSQFIDVKISPTGQYLASTSRNDENTVSLTVMDLTKNKVISITRGKGNESVSAFSWLNDERLLLTMSREIGSLEAPQATGELIAMNANGSKKIILTGRRAKNKDYRFTSIIDILPNDPDQVLVYSLDLTSSQPFLDLYRMKVSNGRKKSLGRVPLRGYDGNIATAFADNEGDVLAAMGIDPTGDRNKTVLMARENTEAEWKLIIERETYTGNFNPIKFLDDGETLIGLSNLETDTLSIATLNIKTKKHEVLLNYPEADLSPLISVNNSVADEVVGAIYEYKTTGALFLDNVKNPKNQSMVAQLVATFKNQSVNVTSATKDNSMFIIRTGSANHPTMFYSFDIKVNKLAVLTPSRPWLKQKMIPTTQIVSYKSRDGLTITGLLTLPVDKESKDLPFVLIPHGGPHGPYDSIYGMSSDPKVLANHGYAVLQPNFRGSGGYGLAFETAGFDKWGTDMINDMTDGTNFLVSEGIVDQDRMCVFGGSYGGYAAIQSVIREPDLYKCTIGFVGVYSLKMMREIGDIPESDYGVNYLNHVLPTDDIQDPIKNVDKIKVPVFIIQGEEDERVPKEHAFALRDALEARKHPVKWMMKSGEGHGFLKPENNVERWKAMLKFFDKHMGES